MHESIIEEFFALVQNPVSQIVIAGIVIYLAIFIILTARKYWNKIFDETTICNKNIVCFIYLPLLLVCCIMGVFSDTVIGMVKSYASDVVRSVLKIIFFPLLLLEIIGQKISKKDLTKRFINAENKNIGNKLKIYQQCTKNLISIDASFLRDYYSENLFKFLAALLQVVSFFTTYAGVELFFGDLFSLSTLFVTLAIQIGLFATAINVSKPGKKNLRNLLLMILLMIISISFSYIGLITRVSSPEETYKEAYEEYEAAFNNSIGSDLASLSQDTIEKNIKSEFKNVISTLGLFDQKIIENIDNKNNLKKGGKPNEFYVSKNGDLITNQDGTTIQEGNITEKNPEYDNYINKLTEYENNISSLIQKRIKLVDDIGNLIGKELKDKKKKKKRKTYYTDMNYDIIEESIQNASLEPLFADEKKDTDEKKDAGENTDGKDKDSGLWTKEKCDILIKANNSALEDEYIKDASSNEYKIDKDIIDTEVKKYRRGNAIENVTLEGWDVFKKQVFSSDVFENKKTFIDKILSIMGSWLGADLDNMEMRNLIDLLQEMQDKVRKNYAVVDSLYKSVVSEEILSELEEKKDKVEQIPNLFFIGFNRFAEPGKHRSNAFMCIALAILNDSLTVALGFVASRKAFSFLYVKTSKDYYNDIDELFGIVFKSMMQKFYISIRKGEFNAMDNSEFMEKCIQVVQETSGAISNFLDIFAISECTSSIGYNLYFRYKTKDEIEDYKPIISVLLKTNMLKVMPYVYYRHLELEYYCGIKLPVWENDLGKEYNISDSDGDYLNFNKYEDLLDENKKEGNVLLLRNRAENYLRENMYVDIKLMEDESENDIPQMNETIENKQND